MLTRLLALISCSVCCAKVSRTEYIKLVIPYPSGIQVDKVVGSSGQEFRFGRLQHNSISIRPNWSTIKAAEGVFTESECKDIVAQAEQHAERFGWSEGRHIDYDVRPTQDLPVQAIFDETFLLKLHDRFATKIWPEMAREYELNPALIRPSDLFITKYNASRKENLLGPHRDKSPFSFVITLNSGYEGGGTYFFETETLWAPAVGSALFFSGSQLHAGLPTKRGVRYILAGFCEYGSVDHSVDISSEAAHNHFMSMYDPLYDGTAGSVGFRSGDLIVGLEVCDRAVREVCSSGEELCTGEVSDNATPTFVRRRVNVTGLTTDEEWVQYAQSCELLDPLGETVLWVRRKKQKRSKRENVGVGPGK